MFQLRVFKTLRFYHILIYLFQVFYPFDQGSVDMGELGGKKKFLIKTSSNIWASQGQQDYEIHVAFTNKVTSAEGNWPRGTCSGPFSLDH